MVYHNEDLLLRLGQLVFSIYHTLAFGGLWGYKPTQQVVHHVVFPPKWTASPPPPPTIPLPVNFGGLTDIYLQTIICVLHTQTHIA